MKQYLFLFSMLIPLLSMAQNMIYYKSADNAYMEIDRSKNKGRICNLSVTDEYMEMIFDIKYIGNDTLQLLGKTDFHYYKKHCNECQVPIYCHKRTYTPHVFWTYKITNGGSNLTEVKDEARQLNFLEYTFTIPIAFLLPQEMSITNKIDYKYIPAYARKSANKRRLK